MALFEQTPVDITPALWSEITSLAAQVSETTPVFTHLSDGSYVILARKAHDLTQDPRSMNAFAVSREQGCYGKRFSKSYVLEYSGSATIEATEAFHATLIQQRFNNQRIFGFGLSGYSDTKDPRMSRWYPEYTHCVRRFAKTIIDVARANLPSDVIVCVFDAGSRMGVDWELQQVFTTAQQRYGNLVANLSYSYMDYLPYVDDLADRTIVVTHTIDAFSKLSTKTHIQLIVGGRKQAYRDDPDGAFEHYAVVLPLPVLLFCCNEQELQQFPPREGSFINDASRCLMEQFVLPGARPFQSIDEMDELVTKTVLEQIGKNFS